MKGDRLSKILANYKAGALTDGSACIEIFTLAAEGNAQALLGRLPTALREAVCRSLAQANPGECRIVESYCGSGSAETYDAELKRREETMRRGMLALERILRAPDEAAPLKEPQNYGVIIEMRRNLRCLVRLSSGEELEAVVTKSAIRRAGCILKPLDGCAVEVRLMQPPRPHRITKLLIGKRIP